MKTEWTVVGVAFVVLPIYSLWVGADGLYEQWTGNIKGSFGLRLNFGLFKVGHPHAYYMAVGLSLVTQLCGVMIFVSKRGRINLLLLGLFAFAALWFGVFGEMFF